MTMVREVRAAVAGFASALALWLVLVYEGAKRW
jgi:hypothetical protein